ncbi:MAG TPA: zf-HC2 domain-containing protein [Capsulimonadaceae bacterium]|nr:zf-HC2 domain-containing protein [Capsulimonadaceae bacterium]
MAFNQRNCEDADRLMQKAIDGVLSPSERESLDNHLEDCPACAAAWEEHRALTRMATAWTRRPATNATGSQDFTAAVLSQIAARPRPVAKPALSALVLRLGFASSIALIVVASYFFSPGLSALWSVPPITAFPADAPVTVWAALAQWARTMPADALAAWNGLLSEQVSYYPAIVSGGLALFLALVLGCQAARQPRGRYQ